MVWDEDTIRLLRELWAAGLSTAEIGRRLSVSKNAIVGKAHRLDLEARPSPIRRDPPQLVAVPGTAPAKAAQDAPGTTLPPLPSTVVPAPAPSAIATEAVPAALAPPLRIVPTQPQAPARPQPKPVALTAPRPLQPQPASLPPRRTSMACCWPIGEPGTKDFRFCDEASLTGKPYCEAHVKLAYVRLKDRKEDAA